MSLDTPFHGPLPEPGTGSVRARHVLSMLQAVSGLPEAGVIRAHLPRGVETSIRGASGMDWLDLTLDLELARSVHAVLGTVRTRRFYRDAIVGAATSPLWRALVDLMRVSGDTGLPRCARWVPRAWALAFREVGAWALAAPEKNRLRLALRGLPASCVGHRPWLEALEGALSVLPLLAGVEGAATLEEAGPRHAVYRVDWTDGPVRR